MVRERSAKIVVSLFLYFAYSMQVNRTTELQTKTPKELCTFRVNEKVIC